MERYSYFTLKNVMRVIGIMFALWILWIILVLNGEELLGYGAKDSSMVFISILLMALPFIIFLSFIISYIKVFIDKSIISNTFFKDKLILPHNRQSSKLFEVLEQTTYEFMRIGKYLIFIALIYSYLYLHF